MTQHFFIVSLPRTRTAWLANLLTYKDSYCFHEAGKYAQSPSQYAALLKSRAERYVGDASSDLVNHLANIPDTSPLVVVHRDADAVTGSLAAFFGNEEIRPALHEHMLHLQTLLAGITRPHLAVDYRDLEDMRILRKIWGHCLPELNFDYQRAEALQRMRVEVHWPKEREFLRKILPSFGES